MFHSRLCINSTASLNAVNRLRCVLEPVSLSGIVTSAALNIRRNRHVLCTRIESAGFTIPVKHSQFDRTISTVSNIWILISKKM